MASSKFPDPSPALTSDRRISNLPPPPSPAEKEVARLRGIIVDEIKRLIDSKWPGEAKTLLDKLEDK